jgi:hypothetical protein
MFFSLIGFNFDGEGNKPLIFIHTIIKKINKRSPVKKLVFALP